MKINKSFILWRLPLILITASISIFAYSLLVSKWHRVEALAQNQPIKTAKSQVEPQNHIYFNIPTKFASSTFYQADLQKGEKYIALTFDDGPAAHFTDQIIKILHQNNIKATFFMIGENVKTYPQQAKNVIANGNVIGNHTWHHWYRSMSPQLAASEIENTANIIYKTTGAKTTLFPPPGGILDNGVAAYAKNQKDGIIIWSDDSEDWRRPAASTLVKRVVKQATPGGIILMHDGGGNRSNTVAALPQIISTLRQQGYKFVTIPELLQIQNKEQTVAVKKETKIPPTPSVSGGLKTPFSPLTRQS
ncbi:polysaccharide deacetylase [Calothrix sp. NIES-4071]|nr:polysaccharide deacetylase [Calothrix sp. NIES-4071]BAZ54579.1 polysaccharide deacetylase [Calothrix sp. NIES-4105]